MLVEDFHSTTIATIGADGHPQTRVIDMMLWDEAGAYFLTAKGKAFYEQLMEQKYVAVSAVKGKCSISLRGTVRNIGNEKLNEIFEKNTYMQAIYPGETRSALEVFHLYKAQGEFFDISDPAHVTRGSIAIGEEKQEFSGYLITDACIGCGVCEGVCPQKCIHVTNGVAEIEQNHCLHCGRCMEVCPVGAIERRV